MQVKTAIFLDPPLKCMLGSGLLAVLDSAPSHTHIRFLSSSSMHRTGRKVLLIR